MTKRVSTVRTVYQPMTDEALCELNYTAKRIAVDDRLRDLVSKHCFEMLCDLRRIHTASEVATESGSVKLKEEAKCIKTMLFYSMILASSSPIGKRINQCVKIFDADLSDRYDL